MLSNYLKLALRNLRKQAFFSLLNILGLSLGLACFALTALHVLDEFSFDRFHTNGDRIYRVLTHTAAGFRNEAETKEPFQPMPLGPAMQRDFPEVETYTRIRSWGGFVEAPQGMFEEDMAFADAPFFKIFSFPLLFGNAETALKEPYSVVLTRKMALKLFGEINPLGRTLDIKIENKFESYIVTAVAEDVPSNSSIEFGILLPFARYAAMPRGQNERDRWTRISFPTFVQLRLGSTLTQGDKRLGEFYARYHPTEENHARQEGWWSQAGSPFYYSLQPIRDIKQDVSVKGSTANPQYAWILLGIGGLILLIACINFTTLTIGRSLGRAREIGVRKVVGAARRQLVAQHLIESVSMSVFSMSLGLLLAYTALPFFNQLIDKQLSFNWRQFPELFLFFPVLTLVAGLLAGAYPALVLSGFRPLESLQNKLRMGGGNWFTRSLLTWQFMLSTGLMICTVVMLRQLHFMQTRNPGFDKENVVVINTSGSDNPEQTARVFQEKLAHSTEILNVSSAEMALGGGTGWSTSGFEYKGKQMEIFEYVVDPEYVPTLGLELLAGRNLSRHVVADTQTSVVINEAAMRAFGWSLHDVIGQPLTGYNEEDPSKNPMVVGVVKDYHFGSFHKEVAPMMLQMFSPYPRDYYFVRLKKGNPENALAQLQGIWAAVEPRLPFRYKFLDESLDAFYKTEQRWSRVVTLAAMLSLFLACLGLLGLAALAAANRNKEIGIRKVLGASVAGITTLLTRDFLKLVFVAIVIASPLAWYFMQRWLSNFAYHIDMQWWMVAVAGLVAVAIAFLTVGFQSVRAALTNPVESLKSE